MKLFDENVRDELGPKLEADSYYRYLNRSARPEAERIRNVLEEWFSHYPNEYRDSLQGKLRSFDNYNHIPAFFELFLHELLLRLDCHMEIHPDLSHTSRRPDFLVKQDNGTDFYLEASVMMNESKEEAGQRARLARIIDKINQSVKSDRLFLRMYPKKISKRSTRTSKLIKWLQEKANNLNSNELLKIKDHSQLPKWKWCDGDWLIEFTPIPKRPNEISGTIERIIGIGPIQVTLDQTKDRLRRNLVGKASRYGQLDRPYIIAVNVMSNFIDSEVIEEILFGDEVYEVEFTESGPGWSTSRRMRNGAWTSERGPRYTRNSAVLIFKRLSPWRVASTQVLLFHNPWAKRKYESVLTCFPQCMLKDGDRHLVDGESPGNILGLLSGWPE